MILYGFPGSPNTWRVRAYADHIGLALDYRFVDLFTGANKTPEMQAILPFGRVPVLVDGDLTLAESNAILQYFGSRKPNDLWPDDARLRAEIMQWQCWQMCHLAKGVEPLLFERVVKRFANIGQPDPAICAATETVFRAEAARLDAHLASNAWLVAGRPTLAEFSVGAYFLHAEGGEFPLADFPHLRRWMGATLALPCWRNTAPPQRPAAAA